MTTKATARVVREVMTRNPICIPQGTRVRELAEILEQNSISGAPVVDAQNRVIGVVSMTDVIERCVEGPLAGGSGSLFAALASGLLQSGLTIDEEELGTVEDIIKLQTVTATQDDTIAKVARTMASERIHRVVVVNAAGDAVGIVTTLDLLGAFPG